MTVSALVAKHLSKTF